MIKVHFIGDVHLGKKFEHGVPLHRRGDREKMQFDHFLRELNEPCDLSIQAGDLFDRFFVPYTVVYNAAMAYRAAAQANPGTTYVVMRGNHDASRDADKVSAFQVFAGLVRPFGIIVADDEAVEIGAHVIIPWHPFKTAIEMLPADLTDKVAVGHWDIVMGDDNQIPAAEMKARGAIHAFTGHDHNARDLEIEGLKVTVLGSMQPYSHAEDPNGDLYVTIGLSEACGDFRTKCVRLILEGDEVLDFSIDCLQLQVGRNKAEAVDLGEVQFEAFDFNEMFNQAAEQVGLSVGMSSKAMEKLELERSARA